MIGVCDFFVGSRLHSCIAALSQGIPTIGIAYSKKFKGVFESVGAGDWVIDGCAMKNQDAIARFIALFEKRASMRLKLTENVANARSILNGTFASILG